MFLVLFVLNQAELLEKVLDAWEESGVSGVTILHSTGLGRTRQALGFRDDIPIFPSLKVFEEHEEYFSRTLFTVVQNEEMADKVISTTQEIVGDLQQPETGLVVVIPVVKVLGLNKIPDSQDQD